MKNHLRHAVKRQFISRCHATKRLQVESCFWRCQQTVMLICVRFFRKLRVTTVRWRGWGGRSRLRCKTVESVPWRLWNCYRATLESRCVSLRLRPWRNPSWFRMLDLRKKNHKLNWRVSKHRHRSVEDGTMTAQPQIIGHWEIRISWKAFAQDRSWKGEGGVGKMTSFDVFAK